MSSAAIYGLYLNQTSAAEDGYRAQGDNGYIQVPMISGNHMGYLYTALVRYSTAGYSYVKFILNGQAGAWKQFAYTSDLPSKSSWNYDDRYVTALGISGNNLTWTKNGTNNTLTVPYATSAGSVAWGNITGKPDSYTPAAHNHDGTYLKYYRHTTSGSGASSFSANSLDDGWHDFKCYVNDCATTTNHGTLIQNSYNGTPFQIWIPDVGYYIYKRYNSGSIGGTWNKIYAGYADSAGSVAWSNVSGKPSTFTPAAHDHDSTYLKLSGGQTLGNFLGISCSADRKLILNNSDSETYWNYISFQDNSTEYGQLGTKGDTSLRWNENIVLHSGNYTTYCATSGHNHDGTYLPLSGGNLTGPLGINSEHEVDWNITQAEKKLRFLTTTAATVSNGAPGRYHSGVSFMTGYCGFQLSVYGGTGSKDLYFRHCGDSGEKWGSWYILLNSGNYTSYTVKKDGTGASGTWGINVSGSAGSVPWSGVSSKPDTATRWPAWSEVTGKPSTFTPATHNHDGVYHPYQGSSGLALSCSGLSSHDGGINIVNDAGQIHTYRDLTFTANGRGTLGIIRGTWDNSNWSDENIGKGHLSFIVSTQSDGLQETLTLANNGNVGVGNTSPQYKLDVSGSLNATTIYQNGAQVSVDGHTHSYLPLSGGNLTGPISLVAPGNNIASFQSLASIGVVSLKGNGSYGTRLSIYDKDNTEVVLELNYNGTATAKKFVKSGGTSSQFLKADGSVDSNSYSTTSHTHSYLPLSGGTISGNINFTSTDPITFSQPGSGTYNKSVIFIRGGAFNLELPRETDASNAAIIPLHIKTRGGQWAPIYAGGFYKGNSDNSYVLLGGGGHKAVSDFATSGHTHSYFPLSGGTISGTTSQGSLFVLNTTSSTGPCVTQQYSGTTKSYYGYYPSGGYTYLSNEVKKAELRIYDNGDFKFSENYTDGSKLYKVWHSGNDGSGSGLDADLLDGTHKSSLLTSVGLSASNNKIKSSITVGGTSLESPELLVPYSSNSGISNYLNTNAASAWMHKEINSTSESYMYHVILLIAVQTTSNRSAQNHIDGKFFLYKIGGNVYDVVTVNLNQVWNVLEYNISCYGQNGLYTLCRCNYNNINYYALKCPYHANPFTNIIFDGCVQSQWAEENVALPLDIAYYYSYGNGTITNQEVYNSITDTLTTNVVTSVNHRPTQFGNYIISHGGFVKSGSSDSYVLLGGSGHKALSDFATTSITNTEIDNIMV